MDEILAQSGHRPWPIPSAPWMMEQRWHDLLFAHWPVARERMRALLPAGLEPDLFDGRAWIGVVPFRMSNVRFRWTPAFPWVSAFPELNVRTYATLNGKAGVHFFSLDALNPVAVAAARAWYRLPYHRAAMACEPDGEGIDYSSVRTHRGSPPAELRARYRPTGEPFLAAEGTLERWLTERYCLYTLDRGGRICRGEIHHQPWPLQPAEAEFERNTMTAPLGLALEGAPSLLFARYLKVAIWGLRSIERDSPSAAARDGAG